ELLQPLVGACPDGVGGDRDGDPAFPEAFELREVRRDRLLPHARQTSPAVRGVDADERDSRLLGGIGGGERGVETEVVELSDRRVAGRPELPVGPGVERSEALVRLALGLREHALAPGPEIASGGTTAERALERMAV